MPSTFTIVDEHSSCCLCWLGRSDSSRPLLQFLDRHRLCVDRYLILLRRAAAPDHGRVCWPPAVMRRRNQRRLLRFCAAADHAYAMIQARAEVVAARCGFSYSRHWDDSADDLLAAMARLRFYDKVAVVIQTETTAIIDFIIRERSCHLIADLWRLWTRKDAETVPALIVDWAVAARHFLDHSPAEKVERRADLDECATAFVAPSHLFHRCRRTGICVICMEAILDGDSTAYCKGRTECGRDFHQNCIEAWIEARIQAQQVPRCPVCNRVWVPGR